LRVKSFAVCWVHQVCEEKFCDFFPSPPSYTHGFPTLQNNYSLTSVSTKVSHSSHEFFLKLSLAYSWNGQEYTLLTHFHAFQDDHAVTGRRIVTVEVSPRRNRSITASLLASSPSYFLISWPAETL